MQIVSIIQDGFDGEKIKVKKAGGHSTGPHERLQSEIIRGFLELNLIDM